MQCLNACKNLNVSCPNSGCRNWVNYESEYNCVLETVALAEQDGRQLTLRDVAKRLGCSFVRVKQIEDEALNKLNSVKESIY